MDVIRGWTPYPILGQCFVLWAPPALPALPFPPTHLDGDDLRAGHLEHGVEQQLLQDAAQSARARPPLDRQARDGLQRRVRERQVNLRPEGQA